MTFIVLVVNEIFDGGFNKRMNVIIPFSIQGAVGCHLFEEGYIVDS